MLLETCGVEAIVTRRRRETRTNRSTTPLSGGVLLGGVVRGRCVATNTFVGILCTSYGEERILRQNEREWTAIVRKHRNL